MSPFRKSIRRAAPWSVTEPGHAAPCTRRPPTRRPANTTGCRVRTRFASMARPSGARSGRPCSPRDRSVWIAAPRRRTWITSSRSTRRPSVRSILPTSSRAAIAIIRGAHPASTRGTVGDEDGDEGPRRRGGPPAPLRRAHKEPSSPRSTGTGPRGTAPRTAGSLGWPPRSSLPSRRACSRRVTAGSARTAQCGAGAGLQGGAPRQGRPRDFPSGGAVTVRLA